MVRPPPLPGSAPDLPPDKKLDQSQSRLVRVWRAFRGWPIWVQVLVALFVVGAIGAPFAEEPVEPTASPKAERPQPEPAPTRSLPAVPVVTSTPTQTTTPTATPTPLAYVVWERKDISYDFTSLGKEKAQRLSMRVEVHRWPLVRTQLFELVEKLIEQERGHGWQAVNLFVGYDRREGGGIPAFGVFEWAPGGEWNRAYEGDAKTWEGYRLNIDWKPKFDHPSECKPPADVAFVYVAEYDEANSDQNNDDILKEIAQRHGVSVGRVDKLIRAAELWVFC